MDIISLHLSVTTCYLVKSKEEKYVLIDTGYAEDWELFKKRLQEYGITFAQVSHLILTHHHDDHCGLLHLILEQNPNIIVVMSSSCQELIQKGENDITHGGGLINRRISFLIRHKQQYVSLILHKKVDKSQNLKFRPYKVRSCDMILQGDELLSSIGIPIDGARVISTPGHTVDSISILFSDGSCMVGDAAAHMLSFAGTKYCVVFVCNIDDYYKSWEKIIAAKAVTIYPAHGKPFPVQKLKENLWKNKAENIVFYDGK